MSVVASTQSNGPIHGRLLQNMAASFAGQAWTILLSLAVIPFYIRLVGMEAFGLIGVNLAVQGFLRLLDFGLTPSINRELARYRTQPERRSEMRDFAWTSELLFVCAGLIIAVALALGLPTAATYWLNSEELPLNTIGDCALLMGVLCGLQWPISFYRGALLGLESHGLCSALRAVDATLNYGGGLLVLVFVSPTIPALFLWQTLVAVVSLFMLAVALRARLPRQERGAKFRWALIRRVWRFAAGMTAISVTALVLTHVDKLVVSRVVSLTEFGYYTLAVFVASGVTALIITPVFNAMFPRFSSLVASGDEERLCQLYHLSMQIMAVSLIPAGWILFSFAKVVLLVWTQDATVAANVSPLLSVYIIGTVCNGLMNPPFAIQLAYGNVKLPISINLGLVALFAPLLVFLVPLYGALACVWIWAGLMLGYVLVGISLTHRTLLKGEAERCWREDLLPTVASCAAVIPLGSWLASGSPSVTIQAVALVLSALLASLLSVLSSRRLRSIVLSPATRLSFLALKRR